MDAHRDAWRALLADPAGVDLWTGALLVARDENDARDDARALGRLDGLARRLDARLAGVAAPAARVDGLLGMLFTDEGFGASDRPGFDPRDSDVAETLATGRGLPIALAVVALVLAARCAVPLHGIGFPGRFLLGATIDGEDHVFDPVEGGRRLDGAELGRRAAAHAGGERPDAATMAHLLAPASPRSILLRMLRNLKAGHVGRDDWAAVLRICDRQLLLAPDLPDALRDRGLAWLELGHGPRAVADLERFLRLHPDADGAPALQRALEQARGLRVRLH